MRNLSFFILAVFLLILMQCGSSNIEEGDQFYAAGDYTQALNSYLAHKKSNPDTPGLNAKIALAYFNKGKNLYDRSRNIKSFEGNYNYAQEYLDGTFTEEQKAEYSRLLYDLAMAYRNTRPGNDIEEEQFFNNTLEFLQMAVDYDAQNTMADSMISNIYMESFQDMFDKGLKAFNRAKQVRSNIDLLLSAERYFSQAVLFNSSHEEAQKYLSSTRKETLGILENITPFSFCVTSYKIDKGNCFVAVAAKNYSNDPITMDLKALTLNTADGNVIAVDMKKTAELEQALKQNTQIEPFKLVEGQLIYSLSTGADLEYIAYDDNDKISVKKYFP